ncbi:substrate-binding domain-containing protein [Streptomyces sp. GC420]|uniref:substrate-binding domain-containing protein n=1 Tax=Streptomyces sp. GC420 TaxID=2697568 RepID=UPI001414D90F|nr:substrate-binding domain-containing protein [Streptomyces sp. GC420]NBM16974.1 substrate-binding domain-containing protein [Streptomyces sp. GC420]
MNRSSSSPPPHGPSGPGPGNPRHRPRRLRAVAAAAILCLSAAGCSASGGEAPAGPAGDAVDAAPAARAGTPRIKVALITHAGPGDTFWELVHKGARAAAAKDNIDLRHSGDPDPSAQADLVGKAVDEKVDGIALTLAKPEAMKSAVARARAAGIAVVGLNSGIDAWQDQGLLEYFGQDESVAGRALGDRLDGLGAEHALCVIHEQGNVAVEARCAGVKKAFEGETENLYVNGADLDSVASAVEDRLRQDPGIDQVVTLGAPFALAAVKSVREAGSDAKVATFDLDEDLAEAVENGDVQFAVDQQPFLQGYLAVDAIWLHRFHGHVSGGGVAPVLTGPAFVTKDNVARIAAFAGNGTR